MTDFTFDSWLGHLPSHWIRTRFGQDVVINEGQVDPTKEPWSSMVLVAPNHIEGGTGRIISLETARDQGADSGKYRAKSGQVLYSKIRPALNKVAIAPVDCLCSADMYPISGRHHAVDNRFLAYWMLARPFAAYATLMSDRVKMPKVNREEVAAAPWTRPPLDEQRRIADFLDAETDRIDRLTTARDRQLTALEELALSKISSIVPSKAHVPFVRLGYLATIQSGITVDARRDSGSDAVTLPYLRVANVQIGRLDLESVTEITVPRQAARSATLRHGDVLMTEGGDLDKLGRGTVWLDEIKNCLHQNHVFAVRPDQRKLVPDYLALITRTAYARSYFESTGTKTTNLASTSSSKIRDFRVPLIELTEQRRIYRETEAWLGDIAKIAAVLQQQLALLRERRQALITAAVTGGITV